MDNKKDVINLKDFAKLMKQYQETKEDANKKELPFSTSENGNLKTNSVKNIMLILEHDEKVMNVFKYNDFLKRIDIVRSITLTVDGKEEKITEDTSLDDIADTIGSYIEYTPEYKNAAFKSTLILQAIGNVARRNHYNPIIDYLEKAAKEYDGKPRMDTAFYDFLGVEKNEVNAIITNLFFYGLIQQIYEPGTPLDFIFDFVGSQGVGKTTFLKKIAPMNLYSDQFCTFNGKDDLLKIAQAIIVNDDEMAVSDATTFNEVKKFSTMQIISFREPYGRTSKNFKRHFVFTRTTNEIAHLRDKSGDRRFLVLEADENRVTKDLWKDFDEEYKKQLLGEAVNFYKVCKKSNVNPLVLTPKQKQMIDESKEDYRYSTGLEDALMDLLEGKFKDREYIQTEELSLELFHGDKYKMTNGSEESKKVRYYLEHCGYKPTRMRIHGENKRGFVKRK